MKKILVIDNNIDPPHGSADIVRSLRATKRGEELAIEVFRGPEQQIPRDLTAFSGVVISGSKTRAAADDAWVQVQMDCVRQLRDLKIPTLGLCYGEQLLVKAFSGNDYLGVSEIGEFGLVEITLTESAKNSVIFQGMPAKFYSYCWHFDEVARLAPEFELTARSKDCEIHAYDYQGAPMWGVQFHPEKNVEDIAESNRLIQRDYPERKIHGADELDKRYDPRVVDIIFNNFVNFLWS